MEAAAKSPETLYGEEQLKPEGRAVRPGIWEDHPEEAAPKLCQPDRAASRACSTGPAREEGTG